MLSQKRDIRVHQIAVRMTAKDETALLLDLEIYAETERPCVVLDCSKIAILNTGAVRLLLACLEVAMKCNGDLRLAELSPSAEATLRDLSMTRLFEIYTTSEAAIQSFHQRPYSIAGMAETPGSPKRDLAYAA